MTSRKSLERRIAKLEQQRYPAGRIFVINVFEGIDNDERVEMLKDRMIRDHEYGRHARDMLVVITKFCLSATEQTACADEITIHKMTC